MSKDKQNVGLLKFKTMKTKFYHVRVKQFCFTNDSELLMICTSKKEANEYKRLYEKCPKYEGMDIYIENVEK